MAFRLNRFQRDSLYWIYPLVILGLIFLANKCENDEEEPVTVIDKDGNLYTSVSIGTQVWMKENLKTTKYNDGSFIPKVTDGTTWGILTTDAYCWYDNDSSTYKSTYGALYNWYAVNTGKLCPAGWHVPTDAEWTALTTFLGGEAVAGGKLKETGTTHWTSPNTNATNESGFTALAGGYRQFGGLFYLIGTYAVFWSASQVDANRSWYRDMSYERGYINKSSTNLTSGFSIRCLKDN